MGKSNNSRKGTRKGNAKDPDHAEKKRHHARAERAGVRSALSVDPTSVELSAVATRRHHKNFH